MSNDPVNHPKHYTSDPSGIECIQITRHRNFNIGNAIKYLWRAGLKSASFTGQIIPVEDGNIVKALQTAEVLGKVINRSKQIEDLKKARWYIADEIQRLGGTVE